MCTRATNLCTVAHASRKDLLDRRDRLLLVPILPHELHRVCRGVDRPIVPHSNVHQRSVGIGRPPAHVRIATSARIRMPGAVDIQRFTPKETIRVVYWILLGYPLDRVLCSVAPEY